MEEEFFAHNNKQSRHASSAAKRQGTEGPPDAGPCASNRVLGNVPRPFIVSRASMTARLLHVVVSRVP